MVFLLLVTSLSGYVAHFSYYITSRLGNGWSQLAAYSLGVLFCLPFVVVIYEELGDIKSSSKRLVCSYLLAYLAFGSGTAAGWITHPIAGPSPFSMDDRGIGGAS